MTQPLNPFQPCLPIGHSSAEAARGSADRLTFGGVITPRDFALMMPNRSLIGCLMVIVTPVCVVGAIGAVTTAFVELNLNGWTIPLFLAVGAVLVGMPIGVYQLLARKRAGRILRKRPDLLGTVEGNISEQGMFLDDGLRKHWFDARVMRPTRALKSGLRVQWTPDSYQYLALSTRMFDNFDAKRLQSWIQEWRRAAATTPGPVGTISPASRLGDPPVHAIDFSGQVTLQLPTDTPESRRQAWSLTVQLIISVVILILASMSNAGSWTGITLIMLVASILYTWAAFATWRRILQGNSVQTISQSGWIGQSELLIEVAGSASRCPITCFQVQPLVDQGVIWFVGEVGMIAVTKDVLTSSDDWQRLTEWFAK